MRVYIKTGNDILAQSDEVRRFEIINETLSIWDKLPIHIKNDFIKTYESDIESYIENLENCADYKSRRNVLRLKKMFSNNSVQCALSKKFCESFLPTGFMKGELYVLSGISGGGKTAFSIMLTSVLIMGYNRYLDSPNQVTTPCIYVSLEQSQFQIEARIMSTLNALQTGKTIPYSALINGSESVQDKDIDLAFYIFEICKKNLLILDLESFTTTPSVYQLIDELSARLPLFEKKPLVIIDRYENILGANDNVNDEVARELKSFAIKHNVPVIVQSQLNKSSIASAKKADGSLDYQKISANSLKGSSGLEHHSSSVMVIVPSNKMIEKDGQRVKLVNLIQPKSRYCENTMLKMLFNGANNIFLDYIETRGRKKKEEGEDDERTSDNFGKI